MNANDRKFHEDDSHVNINQFIKALDKFGGSKGVEKILSESLHEHNRNKNYQKALDLIQPLFDIVRDCPMQSDESIKYVSISRRFEWDIYQHYYPTSPNQKLKNIDSICPINFILRQYALAALELGDTSTALSTISMGIRWNPVYAPYGLMLAMSHSDEKEWDKLLEDLVFYIKHAYTTQDLINCFTFLRLYFIKQKMPEEALYCSYMRADYTGDDSILGNIADDTTTFLKMPNVDKKNLTRKIMSERFKKYDITLGFNPVIIAIAKSHYEEARLAGNKKTAEYYTSILSGLQTRQERTNAHVRRQFIEHSQKHPNYALQISNGDLDILEVFLS